MTMASPPMRGSIPDTAMLGRRAITERSNV